MPRTPLIETDLPFHITNRVNNREWFHLPLEETWPVFTTELYAITALYEARVHAFVLMSNHFHLILSATGPNLGKVMQEFSKYIARLLNRKSGRTGHLFGGPHCRTLITSPRHFALATKYVYRNPVKAGLCVRVEEYPYSTLHGLLGEARLPCPLFIPELPGSTLHLPTEIDQALDWLNQPFANEEQDAIRKALKKRVFKLPSRSKAK